MKSKIHGKDIRLLTESNCSLVVAWDLIKLAGWEPDTEIEIKYTGLRQGEKLYEELITEGEGIVETGHEKIMVLRGNSPSCSELQENLALLFKECQYP